MSLNWKEINLILSELPLQGGQIQKITQPTFRSVLLTIHTPKRGTTKVYLDFSPGATRMHRVEKPLSKEIPTQRFVQFCKKHIVNRRVVSVEQLGQERIVKLTLSPIENPTCLYIRLWSNRGNIYITNTQGKIEEQLFKQEQSKAEERGEWQYFTPQIPDSYEEDNRAIRPWEGVDFNTFIEQHYSTNQLEREFALLYKQVIPLWERELRRMDTQLAKVADSQKNPTNHTLYKRYGDLILSNLYRMERGISMVELEDYEENPEGVMQQIPLKPELSPRENAEWYYKRFRSGRGELEHLKSQQEALTLKREQCKKLLEQGKSLSCTKEAVLWLRKHVKTQQKSSQGREKKIPGLQFYSGEHTILIGRGSTENEELLRSHVRGNDYWLHTRDTPGAYIFIKRRGKKTVPLETLLDAGNLAIHYSKAKKAGRADLYYTQVKYLRKVKGGKKGLVLPTQEKNLYIIVEEDRIERLLATKETP